MEEGEDASACSPGTRRPRGTSRPSSAGASSPTIRPRRSSSASPRASSRPTATCARPCAPSSTSPEFFDPRYYRAKIKSPFEYVVSAVRAARRRRPDGARRSRGSSRDMGEPLYLCQPPTGYSDAAEAWVNSGALLARLNFAIALRPTAFRAPGRGGSLPPAGAGRGSGRRACALLGDRRVATRDRGNGLERGSPRAAATSPLDARRPDPRQPGVPATVSDASTERRCFSSPRASRSSRAASSRTSSSGWPAAARLRARRVLVAIFQRGAVDGLNVLVPYGERTYYDARPSIAVPRPGSARARRSISTASSACIPSLAPLAPLLPATARPRSSTRSAARTRRARTSTRRTSWSRERRASSRRRTASSPRALAGGRRPRRPRPCAPWRCPPALPRILAGSRRRRRHDAASPTSASAAGGGPRRRPDPSSRCTRTPAPARAPARRRSESFEAVRILQAADPPRSLRRTAPTIPRGPFGNALEQIAQLIKADVGLEIAFTDVGGWDTHAGEGGGGPARQPPARLRPRDRRVREGPRLAHGRRHARHACRSSAAR